MVRRNDRVVRRHIPKMTANDLLLATPVFAILSILSRIPGAPDHNRWAIQGWQLGKGA